MRSWRSRRRRRARPLDRSNGRPLRDRVRGCGRGGDHPVGSRRRRRARPPDPPRPRSRGAGRRARRSPVSLDAGRPPPASVSRRARREVMDHVGVGRRPPRVGGGRLRAVIRRRREVVRADERGASTTGCVARHVAAIPTDPRGAAMPAPSVSEVGELAAAEDHGVGPGERADDPAGIPARAIGRHEPSPVTGRRDAQSRRGRPGPRLPFDPVRGGATGTRRRRAPNTGAMRSDDGCGRGRVHRHRSR